ncbi:MAG: sulfotransferase [Notoacmeibacter sp.]|nr:sulfotransferase [Notoacmeibacter sp.]MCC0031803.1 sulfotransferase [Brucellaceae bacterium]
MLDFLGIGAQKAGTAWLFYRLREHPEAWFSPGGKEIHFFDVVHLGTDRARRLAVIRKNARKAMWDLRRGNPFAGTGFLFSGLRRLGREDYAFTDDWYRDLFSSRPKGGKAGEITPVYAALPEAGVRHVHALMPDVPIIHILRDPLDRAISSLRMQLEDNPGMDAATAMADPVFRARCDYRANVARWESVFDPAQILHLPFGDIKSDPLGVLHRVEAHVGLSRFDGYDLASKSINSSASNNAVITPAVRATLEAMVEGQQAFVEERFGRDFASRLK